MSADVIRLKKYIELLANASRTALEEFALTQREFEWRHFPRGTCGPVAELMGRIILERTGVEGTYVCGEEHPNLPRDQSHAWVVVRGLIVDLTYDQFDRTGLRGWVFEKSPWHSRFTAERQKLCLDPCSWMQYPYSAYSAMKAACDAVAFELP